MSQRFQIEDIVVQDSSGIVFRALDTETNSHVALRRFFPFGANGGGLDEHEQESYQIAVARLSAVSHPALRSVICGGCDPVDGMPFIATEWIEGKRLGSIIAERPLTVPEAGQLLANALDVCMALSEVLGEEAIWVETELKAIVFGAEGTGRGVTFWISPLEWLGQKEDRRGLQSIARLTENVMDWHGKVVTDAKGKWLGNWLRWLRGSAKTATLAEAREKLEEAILADAAEAPRSDDDSDSSSAISGTTIISGALMLAAAGWVGWSWLKQDSSAAGKPGRIATSTVISQRPIPAAEPKIFTLQDHAQLVAEDRNEVTMQGILSGMRYSKTRTELYLLFSKRSPGSEPRGEIALNEKLDSLTEAKLTPLLGKTIRIRGKVRVDEISDLQRPLVMVQGPQSIEVIK